MFTGFTEETLRFFLDLRFHNDMTWFHANHDRYVAEVVTPFYALIDDLAPVMRKIDPTIEVRPHRCLARIHRDTRFTKDKSPYRDHLWLLFRRQGEPREGSVFYWFELSVNATGWGVGVWGDNRPMLDQLRRRMAADPKGVMHLISSCDLPERGLAFGGRQFKRIDVPANIPAMLQPWYRAKEIYVAKAEPDYHLIYQPELVSALAEDFTALAPIYHLLRGAADLSE